MRPQIRRDVERYPTITRLLPLHRDVLELALATTFCDWPDNIARPVANTVPQLELAPLFAELAGYHRAAYESRELELNDPVHVARMAEEFEERAKRLEHGR
jgi:hypothetical protein